MLALSVGMLLAVAAPAGARVLLVGTFHGHKGSYKTVQSAVKAAHKGDWILIAPGDYKTSGASVPAYPSGADQAGAAVLIRTADLHVRGMDRNGTWIDGTKSGTPKCSNSDSAQNFGTGGAGLNGVIVYKVSGVSLENFSVCNFLTGSSGGGNGIWFDGGGGSGKQTAMSFKGNYLTATSSYYKDVSSPAASYGIYSSNTKGGPGLFSYDYANDMNDSGYYVGACPDCQVTLNHIHAQDSILGYSGTNSGGHLIIENSEFDHNQDGFDTNSENNDDAPSPQSGACPHDGLGPRPAGTQLSHSCWVFEDNYVHDNNNPDVPGAGIASNGPIGTGMTVSGGRNDIVVHNRFLHNGSWGLLLLPFPDTGTPPPIANCAGGSHASPFGPSVCYFDDWGNEVADNTFSDNGFFGNPTNGDVGDISGTNTPGNCWHGNTDSAGALTSAPANIQSTHGRCGVTNSGEGLGDPLTSQVLCATQIFAPCPAAPGMDYPRLTKVLMPAPPKQTTMSNPCSGVPSNAWCRGGKPV
jgi:hypothetical protein